MTYDFDRVVSRRGTCSLRWDEHPVKFHEPDLISLTTADMGFQAPPPVREAIEKAAAHGIYGYSHPGSDYYEAVVERFAKQWKWDIRPEWLVFAPGVVNAIAYCLQSMTSESCGVVMPLPMYHPFAHVIENNHRLLLPSQLVRRDGTYVLDLDSLERAATDPRAEALIFCNPHNPIGRAWTAEELGAVLDICLRHDLLLICDEIHNAFVFSGHRFTSMAAVAQSRGEDTLEKLIICSSASKAYNLAGLQAADIIIPSEKLRSLYQQSLMQQFYMGIGLFPIVAYPAAYRECDDWLAQLVTYLEGNRDYLVKEFAGRVPEIVPIVPEATYMIWLDCRALGMSDEELEQFFVHKAKVSLNNGSTFGTGGTGYVRMNFAEPRSILEEAMDRIAGAVASLR